MKFVVYKHGDTRTRKGFLWFPRSDGTTMRWLEFAKWEEELDCEFAEFHFRPYRIVTKERWVTVRWLDIGERC